MGHRTKERQAGGGARTARLQELIREELDFALRGEARDPRLYGVTVTMVELARDGSCAHVWFSADGEGDQAEALAGAVGFLRNHLAETLGLKRTPELRFRRDRASRALAPATTATTATTET